MVDSKALYEGDPMARPYVLKPVNEGSSVGVAIVTDESNYGHPISARAEGPWKHFDRLLAEPFIRGRELTVAVLGDEALCVTELKPKAGFYDFDAKYTDGLTEHVCPAEVPAPIAEAMMAMALRAHQLARLQGRVALGLPLGRRAGRGRAVLARDQHPAGDDPAQPRPRAGASRRASAMANWSSGSSPRRLAQADGRGARQARGRRADQEPQGRAARRRAQEAGAQAAGRAGRGQPPRDLGVRAVRAGDRGRRR